MATHHAFDYSILRGKKQAKKGHLPAVRIHSSKSGVATQSGPLHHREVIPAKRHKSAVRKHTVVKL